MTAKALPVRRRALVLTALLALCGALQAQQMDVHLLTPPASPGFTLLGIQPTSVDRPGSPANVNIQLLANTEDLSTLPENYALDFAPYWLFKGPTVSYDSYAGPGFWASIQQSFQLSIALSNREFGDDARLTSLGFGMRVSLLRGRIDPDYDDYTGRLAEIREHSGALDPRLQERIRENTERSGARAELVSQLAQLSLDRVAALSELQADSPARSSVEAAFEAQIEDVKQRLNRLDLEIARRAQGEVLATEAAELEHVTRSADGLTVHRRGWKLDLAGGWVSDFPNRVYNDGDLRNWGAWINGGYEASSRALMGVVRFLDDKRDAGGDCLDVGGRMIFDSTRRFSFSGELTYRNFIDRSDDKPTFRWVLGSDLAIGRNRTIAFMVGADFDRDSSESLLLALQLGLGFGVESPVGPEG